MNILLVLPSLLVGGAEVFAVRLANCLAKCGHHVFLLHIESHQSSPLLEERIANGVTVVPFKHKLTFWQTIWWKSLYTLTGWNRELYGKILFNRNKLKANQLVRFLEILCEREKIQVINTHIQAADWMVGHYFLKKPRPQKFVISMHGCYNRVQYKSSPVYSRSAPGNRRLLEAADEIVLLTSKNAIPLEGLSLKCTPVYIPLGFESKPESLPAKSSVVAKPLTFGLVSRAVPRKGWEEAIKATVILYEEGIECRLILVGGGEYQQQLAQEFSHLPCIHFAGATATVLDWVQQFDIGLFPSYIESESYPNTVIEYLACGKPVIGTNLGEVKNMMSAPDRQQLAGQLLQYDPAGISVTELADYLRQYANDRQLLQSHGELARAAFKKFDMDRCVLAYEQVYSQASLRLESSPVFCQD